jgi:hypothetical protein
VILEELIEYIASHRGVWFGTHAAIAAYVWDEAQR